MKATSITKRVIALTLTVIMLVSCWVFTAPKADAADTKYTIRLVGYTGNDFDPGTCRFYVTYKTKNGTNATTANSDWFSIPNSVGKRKSIFSGGGANYGYFPSDDGVQIDGFPVSFTVNMTKTSNGLFWDTDGGYNFKLQVKKTNGWDDYGGTQTNNGNITTGTYYKGLCEVSKVYSGKFNKTDTSGNVAATDYPYAQAGGTITLNTSSVTLDGTSDQTVTATKPTANDQYNVTMDSSLCTLSRSCSVSTTGISISGTTVTCTKDAHISTVGTNQQTVTVNGSWSSANTSHASVACTSASFTVTDEKYTVTWKYLASSSSSTTGTATQYTTNKTSYGDKVTVPTNVAESYTKYYTTSKHYTGGSFTGSANDQVLSNVTKTMAGYTENNHSYAYSELSSGDANYHSKHTGSCTCGYSTTFAHQYGATTFSFGDDGKTATATRQCTTNGCKHEQSRELSLGSGITSAKTANETCTAPGTTTYTATSPFGDGATGTKAVNDIPAQGHSWGAWRDKENGTEHIRDCQRDGCDATDSSAHTYPADPSYTSNGNGKNNTHYYTCTTAGCGYQNTSPHTWNDGVVTTPATCTEDGVKTYTCTAKGCGATYTETIPATGHAYGDFADDNNSDHSDPEHDVIGTHSKVCANDGSHVVTENHAFTAWSNSVPDNETVVAAIAAAVEARGDDSYDPETECYRYCTVCYRVEFMPHSYNSEIYTEPTCTTVGVTMYTCKYCSKSYTDANIAALGHSFVPEEIGVGDYANGFVAMHCTRCDKYAPATYNSSTGYAANIASNTEELTVTDPTTGINPTASAKLPKLSFNSTSLNRSGTNCPYYFRPASLLLDYAHPTYTGKNTTQILRFIAMVVVPTGLAGANTATLEVCPNAMERDDVDDVITDFGFVYSQERLFESAGYATRSSAYGTAPYDQATFMKEFRADEDRISDPNDDASSIMAGRVVKMSVAEDNSYQSTSDVNSGWSGCTWNFEKSGTKISKNYLTFNLTIAVTAKNWNRLYIGRSYIKYKYHGREYTVYDECGSNQQLSKLDIDTSDMFYSRNSVYYVAQQAYANAVAEENTRVQNYLLNKVLNSRTNGGSYEAWG